MGEEETILMESGLPYGPQTSNPLANAIVNAALPESSSKPGT